MSEDLIINKSVFFLFFIDSVCDLMGCDMAKGMLQRLGQKISDAVIDKYSEEAFHVNSFEDFVNTDNPLKFFDDTLVIEEGNLFILERCPFADLIAAYKKIAKVLPATFSLITEIYNSEGLGYAVSPFCIIHQTYRRLIAEHIEVAGKDCELMQLGCKAGSGVIKFAHENLERLSVKEDLISSKLENRSCIYIIRLKE